MVQLAHRNLKDFTDEQNQKHKLSCQLRESECGWCRYLGLIRVHNRRFALLPHVPNMANMKVQLLGKVPWLAIKYDGDNVHKSSIWVGRVACHAYAQDRPHKVNSNAFADFAINATKLVDARPRLLLRHVGTNLHQQAVAAMLDLPCGAP